ncbi:MULTISPECIES: hypothetical protein [unclassified Leifsonia]|uniref:hypothetical protein n=1 Tax=unclassified Leifsonia TaxID=2663824 RepID=UPI0006FC47A0|nr:MULTISPECIES: hypothetical protein [unclassified Leifsonia]KQX07891.1 hypothetical protein ASC59_09285 [Leifsonia sp. Root1293]KRA12172.1 hypothetical protein ASD61_09285 [Leifsonia sp. Root60]
MGSRWGLIAALAVVVVLGSTGCTRLDGDALAEQEAWSIAERIGDDLAPSVMRARTAEWLVASHVQDENVELPDGSSHRVEALSWSGATSDAAGAQLLLRISVDIAAHSPDTVGDIARAAGSATLCAQYTVVGDRYGDAPDLEQVDCPDGDVPPLPSPSPPPTLDPSSAAILEAVLLSTDAAGLEADVMAAFPQDYVAIETTVGDGRLIAAVGVPSEGDCIVGVRESDGSVRAGGGFPPERLMPGEIGCSTRLVTAPPL